VETRGRSKGFGSDRAVEPLALNGASYTIEGFVGPNVAGKITTSSPGLSLARPK
jgi:ABC-type uncharacterized transport system ATPase subunit